MRLFLQIAYLVIGFIQIFAVIDGIRFAIGITGLFAFILAAILSYVPFLGSVIGTYGAMNVWDWSFLQAFLLFFWFVPVLAIIYLFELIFNRR